MKVNGRDRRAWLPPFGIVHDGTTDETCNRIHFRFEFVRFLLGLTSPLIAQSLFSAGIARRSDRQRRKRPAGPRETNFWIIPMRKTTADKQHKGGGPLVGTRVIEMNAIGPVPFCGMMLADMGADVARIVRDGSPSPLDRLGAEVLLRGRTTLTANLKYEVDRAALLELIGHADILIEGFRPGVMERLGFGPDACLARNRRLVYGRMTGWGQQGPLAPRVGHDINYIGLSGALSSIGKANEPPTVPLNLVGDYGGGAMLLLAGVLAARVEAQRSGKGQVVDAAMTDGSALLMSLFYAIQKQGVWPRPRGGNLLDGGAPFYRCYRCADGEYMAVGAIEPAFFAELLKGLGIPANSVVQLDRNGWPAMEARFADIFASKSRAEWMTIFEGRDACVSPVLSIAEAPQHPHNIARRTFVETDGTVHPAPGPRFSRTPSNCPKSRRGDFGDLLRRWKATV